MAPCYSSAQVLTATDRCWLQDLCCSLNIEFPGQFPPPEAKSMGGNQKEMAAFHAYPEQEWIPRDATQENESCIKDAL